MARKTGMPQCTCSFDVGGPQSEPDCPVHGEKQCSCPPDNLLKIDPDCALHGKFVRQREQDKIEYLFDEWLTLNIQMPESFVMIDVGVHVFCDLCGKDFTDSSTSGGFLFGSKAVGPCCCESQEQKINEIGEEWNIKDRCPKD